MYGHGLRHRRPDPHRWRCRSSCWNTPRPTRRRPRWNAASASSARWRASARSPRFSAITAAPSRASARAAVVDVIRPERCLEAPLAFLQVGLQVPEAVDAGRPCRGSPECCQRPTGGREPRADCRARASMRSAQSASSIWRCGHAVRTSSTKKLVWRFGDARLIRRTFQCLGRELADRLEHHEPVAPSADEALVDQRLESVHVRFGHRFDGLQRRAAAEDGQSGEEALLAGRQ